MRSAKECLTATQSTVRTVKQTKEIEIFHFFPFHAAYGTSF